MLPLGTHVLRQQLLLLGSKHGKHPVEGEGHISVGVRRKEIISEYLNGAENESNFQDGYTFGHFIQIISFKENKEKSK